MVTIFSIPRDFKEPNTARRQRNAVKSWTGLTPRPEVILFGDDAGIEECCAELDVRHVPDILKNEYGTPYVNAAFKTAREIARNDILCFVNADIILTDRFMEAIRRVVKWKTKFCLVGRRMNLPFSEDIDLKDPDWQKNITDLASAKGYLHVPLGSDFFVFPRKLSIPMPSFVVGRPAWDNWMIYYFRKTGIPLVDISTFYVPFHQDHDYAHVLNRHNRGRGHAASGIEGDRNIALLGYDERVNFHLEECSYVMDEVSICAKEASDNLYRREALFRAIYPTAYHLQKLLYDICEYCGIRKYWVVPLFLFLFIVLALFICRAVWGAGHFIFFLGVLMALSFVVQVRVYYKMSLRMNNDAAWARGKLAHIHGDVKAMAKKISDIEAASADFKKKNERRT